MAFMKQPKCLKCGSTDVQTAEWVSWDADGKPEADITSEGPSDSCWCPHCEGDFGCTWDDETPIGDEEEE